MLGDAQAVRGNEGDIGTRDPGQDRPGAVRVVVRMEVQKATGYGA